MTMKTIKRAIIHLFQRIFYGFDDNETQNLDYHFAKYMVPRLKRFKQLKNTCPPWLRTEEWDKYLDQIIEAFEFYSSDSAWKATEKDCSKYVEALELFGIHFHDLWWNDEQN